MVVVVSCGATGSAPSMQQSKFNQQPTLLSTTAQQTWLNMTQGIILSTPGCTEYL